MGWLTPVLQARSPGLEARSPGLEGAGGACSPRSCSQGRTRPDTSSSALGVSGGVFTKFVSFLRSIEVSTLPVQIDLTWELAF